MSRFAPLFVVAISALSACQLDMVTPDGSKVEPTLVDVTNGDAVVASGTGYSFQLNTAADAMRALPYATPCTDCLDRIEERAVGLAEDASCPVITRSAESIEIVGDCTTVRGVEFVGSMSVHNVDTARLTAFSGFEIHDHENGFDFEANGSYRVQGDENGVDYAFNLTYLWHDGDKADGSFAYDLDLSRRGGVETISGEVQVDAGAV